MTLERSAAETQWESEHFLVSRTSLQPAPRSHYDVTVRKVLAGNGIDRNVMLEQLRAKEDRSEAVDLVVVGGGITGAGVALDAALRGFDVVLVERGDFASGTSSKSSKLVHGGLRYLQQGDVALVREALRERSILQRIAQGRVEAVSYTHLTLPTILRV